MQEIILPDYLDGSAKIKDSMLGSIRYLCGYAIKYMTPIKQEHLGLKEGLNEGLALDMFAAQGEMMSPELVRDLLAKDDSLQMFLRVYYEYHHRSHKNYVIAGALAESFSQTKLDIKGKYIPRDFTAFFHIRGLVDNDGDEVKGVFVSIDKKFIRMGRVNFNKERGYNIAHHYSALPEDDESISDVIKRNSYVVIGDNALGKTRDEIEDLIETGFTFNTVTKEATYDLYQHVIFNSILYVTHCEELKEEINIFSTKRSKRDWEQNKYTQKPYILVGHNFQVPKVYTAENVLVRGHWRWQPHGPQNLLLKHIYIDPYIKNKND